MARKTDTPKPLNPYVISTLVVIALFMLGLFFWIFTRPVTDISYLDKGLMLTFLVVLGGHPVLEYLSKRFSLQPHVTSRISLMLFYGLIVGFVQTEHTVGPFNTVIVFLTFFALTAIAVFGLDVLGRWLFAKWQQRKTHPSADK